MDKREQELIAAVAKAESQLDEAYHHPGEAYRRWAKAYNALEAYRAAKREGGQ